MNYFERKKFVNYEQTAKSDDSGDSAKGKDSKPKDTGVTKEVKDGKIIESAAPIVSQTVEIQEEEVVVNNKSKSKP